MYVTNCPWCRHRNTHFGSVGKVTCSACGHRADMPRPACDCTPCLNAENLSPGEKVALVRRALEIGMEVRVLDLQCVLSGEGVIMKIVPDPADPDDRERDLIEPAGFGFDDARFIRDCEQLPANLAALLRRGVMLTEGSPAGTAAEGVEGLKVALVPGIHSFRELLTDRGWLPIDKELRLPAAHAFITRAVVPFLGAGAERHVLVEVNGQGYWPLDR